MVGNVTNVLGCTTINVSDERRRARCKTQEKWRGGYGLRVDGSVFRGAQVRYSAIKIKRRGLKFLKKYTAV